MGAPFLGCLIFLYSCPDARKTIFDFEILLTGQGQFEEGSLCVTPVQAIPRPHFHVSPCWCSGTPGESSLALTSPFLLAFKQELA